MGVSLRLGGDAFNSFMRRMSRVPLPSKTDSTVEFEETGSTPYDFHVEMQK